MKTDDLIAAPAADTQPQPAVAQGLGVMLGSALFVAFAAVVLFWGLRANPMAGLAPLTVLKTLVPLVLGVLAVMLALRRVHPAVSDGKLPRLMGLAPVVILLAMLSALIFTPNDSWSMQVTGKTIWVCLYSIPTLAILPLAALLTVLRRGAALRPTAAGFAAGLAAGAFAATLYSLHCSEDSPLFYGLWYSTGILTVGAVGAALGRVTLRF